MEDYILRDIKCPFYLEKQGDRYRIKCEGPHKYTTTQITFVGDKSWYMKDFCRSNYQKCRVYRMLCDKWDDNQKSTKSRGG